MLHKVKDSDKDVRAWISCSNLIFIAVNAFMALLVAV